MLSCSVMFNSLWLHGLQPARLLCAWGFSRQEEWSGLPCHLPGDLPNPGIEPRSPVLQEDSLPSELPGKPKNTGVGTWSLLQGILTSQESNRSLLHYTWILYQLSYQGSKMSIYSLKKKKKKTNRMLLCVLIFYCIAQFYFSLSNISLLPMCYIFIFLLVPTCCCCLVA